MAKQRLKKGDISIKNLLTISYAWYKSADGDSKPWRAKLDIKGGRVTARRGLDYNKKTKSWDQSAREVKVEILVKSQPSSYKDKSQIKSHWYPVTILIKNWEKKFDSAFRYRTGSQVMPKFPTKKVSQGKNKAEKDKIRDKNLKIQQRNIKKGIQLQFFFQLEFAMNKWGLLFGRNRTNGSPSITNKGLVPFCDKHFFYICKKVLPSLFDDPKLNQRFGPLE